MATLSGKRQFLESEEAGVLRQDLQAMVDDPNYNTKLRYSYTTATTDGSGFVIKHIEYMSNHLQMNHKQYILNLKLMTKFTGAGAK